MFSVATTNT